MKEKFIQYVKKNTLFSPGDSIVVGVSGGADSVCLLRLLSEYKEQWQLALTVVHVNHGIRGEEAKRDGVYVEQLAKQYDLPFFLVEKDVKALAKKNHLTEEEAGRIARYEELERIRQETKAQWIAVGHHQEDQAETMLFQLFRGAGARGLAAMSPKRGAIIRPMLAMSRDEIETYLKEESISYCHDATNEDMTYSRNRIRRQILPIVKGEINGQAVAHIAEAAEDMRMWRAYVEEQAAKAAGKLIQRGQDEIGIQTELFLQEPEAIQYEILHQMLQMLPAGVKDVSRTHYHQVRQLFFADSGKRINLPRGIVAESRRNSVWIFVEKGEARIDFYMECEIPSSNIVDRGEATWRITLDVKKREDLPQEIPQKDYTKWFDYDKIKGDLSLRSPQEGDFFILDESGHRKKINKYFRDKKIVGRERALQLVLAEGDKIVWAIPERIGADYKITEKTRNVLVASITK